MSITLRSSANVVNGTAGTSVTVAKPAGTVDGDFLVAFVSRNSSTIPSAPSGWKTLGSQLGNSSSMILGCWYKVAAGEPASWTWTVLSSINWGWVGAYTGVDTNNPIAAFASLATTGGTTFAPGSPSSFPRFCLGVSAASAIRTASGTATTWTPSGTEVFDGSTNVGSGTDIAGEVQQTLSSLSYDAGSVYTPLHTASQSQSQGVAFALTLNAYFSLPRIGDVVPVVVEAAMGADLTADPNTWIWTDLSARAKTTAPTIARGRNDEAGTTQASRCTLVLDDTDGWLSPRHPSSPWYLLWGRDTPIRVKQRYTVGGSLVDFLRFQGGVDSIAPTWPSGEGSVARVEISASGRLKTVTQGGVLHSPLARGISSQTNGVSHTPPMLYYPFEDASGSTSAAEFFGGPALALSGGTVSWGADSSIVGSAPIAKLGTGASFAVQVPTYANTGSWRIEFLVSLPSAPGVDVNLLTWWTTGGTGDGWKARYQSSDQTIRLQSFGPSGELLGAGGVNFAGLYGKTVFVVVNAQQSGGSLNWQIDVFATGGGGSGQTGTTASFTLGILRRAATTQLSQVDGGSYGHLALFNVADTYSGGLFTNFDFVYLDGHTEEDATSRIVRVLGENGVTMDSPTLHNDPQHFMGPQPVASLATILREAEAVDNGILCDGVGPGLTYLPLGGRYNATAKLVLDAARGQVKMPFLPVEDDQRTRDDVTASRPSGSSARYKVGTGRYPDPVTVNTADDTSLMDEAAFRVALGQAPEMRVPTISIQLRDKPELLQQWLKCDIGSRFTVANLPPQYPPGGLDLVIEYYTETFDGTWHTVDLIGFPFAPFRTHIIADATQGRLESAGHTVAADITTTAASVQVSTAAGQQLLTTKAAFPADFPFDLDIEGERVTVTDLTGSSSPQTLTVTRGVNGVVKAHSAGAVVKGWRLPGIAL